MQETKSSISPKLVQEFVGVAHVNFDRVKELLGEAPGLLNAAWDWGGGDWESALGAAAHMGRRDIALFLLNAGARLDVFAAAMLGKLEVVKSILESEPAALYHAGPHGIPLLEHAKAGGESAAMVVELLESQLSS